MYIPLPHTKLDVFDVGEKLIMECYKLVATLPADERFNLGSQIKRASLSIILNLSEGSSRSSNNERKRFYEIARSSLIEVDTAIHMSVKLGLMTESQTAMAGDLLYRCYGMLSNMIRRLLPKE